MLGDMTTSRRKVGWKRGWSSRGVPGTFKCVCVCVCVCVCMCSREVGGWEWDGSEFMRRMDGVHGRV